MSESIRRKGSSRQLLQNLIRVTAQRSQEDAEEVERERRRRSREKERREGSPSWPEPPQHDDPAHNTELDEDLKPSCCLVLEEDEGFSDWSHRLENRNEQEVADDCARLQRPSKQQWKQEPQKEKQQENEEEEGCEPEPRGRSKDTSARLPEKSNRKEVRTSYSSTVFLPQDARLQHATGQPADRTSYLVAGTMRPRGRACRMDEEVEQEEQKGEEVQAALQTEWRSAETRQRPRDEDHREEGQMSFTREEKADPHLRRKSEEDHREEAQMSFTREEKADLHLRRKRVEDHREEAQMSFTREEKADLHLRRKEEEEEDEHKMSDKMSVGGRRSEEVNRRSEASVCSSEGEESLNCYGPMSPTFKKLLIQFYPDEVNSRVSTDGKCTIIERTESLKKSTNNMKKMLPVAVSKINKKLEQYTHALKVSSKEGRSGPQVLMDVTSPTEPVSSKKNLFEAGEAWNQNAVSASPSKDADGLKVGVANLINQWVRGSEDGSRCSSPFKPADSSRGKRHKFVVTGHGKYEKVSVDDGCSEDANCQSAEQFYEDL